MIAFIGRRHPPLTRRRNWVNAGVGRTDACTHPAGPGQTSSQTWVSVTRVHVLSLLFAPAAEASCFLPFLAGREELAEMCRQAGGAAEHISLVL